MRCYSLLITVSIPLTLLAGCDPESDPAEEPSSCDCIVDEDDANPPSVPSDPTCGEMLCPSVSASCGGYCSSPLVVSNPEALECALTALRDGTPGVVRWSIVRNEGQFREYGYLLINGDGTAVRRTYGPNDLTYRVSDAVLGPLRSADHFAGCLAEESEQARLGCLTAALEQTAVCDMGWTYDNF